MIFFITGGQQETGLTKNKGNMQPFTLIAFTWGDCGDVKGPRWYKCHSQAIPRTSGVRLQRWEAHCILSK